MIVEVFWVVAPCDWLISYKCLTAMDHFLLRVYESVHRLITLEIKAYIPSKHQEGIIQPHNTTIQKT
jgi:hypothetical protein